MTCQWKIRTRSGIPCGEPAVCEASCRKCGGAFGKLCENHADMLAHMFDDGFQSKDNQP